MNSAFKNALRMSLPVMAEFLALGMLLADFNPASVAAMGLVVGARHLFYGVSMLDRYRNMGWRKPLLMFWLTDETFAINYNAKSASAAEMLWVSLLDYLYWITGGLMGYTFGSLINFDIRGLDFVVTAMFVTIFIDQFLKEKEHRPAWIGIGCTALSLIVHPVPGTRFAPCRLRDAGGILPQGCGMDLGQPRHSRVNRYCSLHFTPLLAQTDALVHCGGHYHLHGSYPLALTNITLSATQLP